MRLPHDTPNTDARTVVANTATVRDRASSVSMPDMASDTPTARASILVANAASRRCFMPLRSTVSSDFRRADHTIEPPIYRSITNPMTCAALWIKDATEAPRSQPRNISMACMIPKASDTFSTFPGDTRPRETLPPKDTTRVSTLNESESRMISRTLIS